MTYVLFVDDERDPVRNDAVIVRSYDEAVDYIIEHGMPVEIMLDHDLGGEKTGYDFAKWLVDYDLDLSERQDTNFPDVSVHSQNPVGKKNIEELITSYLMHKLTLAIEEVMPFKRVVASPDMIARLKAEGHLGDDVVVKEMALTVDKNLDINDLYQLFVDALTATKNSTPFSFGDSHMGRDTVDTGTDKRKLH